MKTPLAVLDFEASALDHDSFPIEVGLAVAKPATASVTVWSTLIKPTAQWAERGRWSRASEKVHGLSVAELGSGSSVREVAEELDARCAGFENVWCDGGDYDQYWLDRLYGAARLVPSFTLSDITNFPFPTDEARECFDAQLKRSKAGHRAGADAERLCAALLKALDGF